MLAAEKGKGIEIMGDKRIKEECPFCHTPKEQIQVRRVSKELSILYCPVCGCSFEGGSIMEVVNKWNRRPPTTVSAEKIKSGAK